MKILTTNSAMEQYFYEWVPISFVLVNTYEHVTVVTYILAIIVLIDR